MMNRVSQEFARFTAWSAIAGGLLAYVTAGLLMAVTGWDPQSILHGTTMLSLPEQTRDLFRWAMLVDIFGFYLPILVIGGYFWHAFGPRTGASVHVAVLAMAFYVTVGISGASIQQAVVHPLSQLYTAGDATTKAAAVTAWTTIAHAAQGGLWWCEGPAVLLWTLVVGKQLRMDGWRGSLLLQISGWSCGLFFLSGFFPSFGVLTSVSGMVVASMLPLWMIVFGWQLRQRSKQQLGQSVGTLA